MFKEWLLRNRWVAVVVLAVVVSLTGFAVFSVQFAHSAAQLGSNALVAQADDSTSGLFTQIYQEVSPSVVAINVTIAGRNGRIVGSGTGSGFVIDHDGHIVTNYHVVEDARDIEIELYDGTLVSAEVVGLDPDSDLAVLHVDVPSQQLVPVTFGDSDALTIGETVLAIGSPYGQNWTLTAGIVSGLDRVISGLTNFAIGGVIQTDAAINPGNSGGPLLNLDGQVVGVNSQISTESGSNSGVGYAVPSNLVQRVAQELIADGTVDYSYIGISGTDVTLAILETLGISGNVRGVVVAETAPGSPAAQAGLQSANVSQQSISAGQARFDVITSIDGVAIKGMDDLISFLARETVPGQTVTLTVLRDGTQSLNVPVMLSSRP